MGGGGFMMDALSRIRYNRSLRKGRHYNERLKNLYKRPLKTKRKAFSSTKISKSEIKYIRLKILQKDKLSNKRKQIIVLTATLVIVMLSLYGIYHYEDLIKVLEEYFYGFKE